MLVNKKMPKPSIRPKVIIIADILASYCIHMVDGLKLQYSADGLSCEARKTEMSDEYEKYVALYYYSSIYIIVYHIL